jgi:hypothetical protein
VGNSELRSLRLNNQEAVLYTSTSGHSYYRQLFGFFLLNTDCVPLEMFDRYIRRRGTNSISNFDHRGRCLLYTTAQGNLPYDIHIYDPARVMDQLLH